MTLAALIHLETDRKETGTSPGGTSKGHGVIKGKSLNIDDQDSARSSY